MREGQSDREVRDLLDRSAITELVSRLGRWLDEKQYRDVEASAALLSPDIALHTPGGKAKGLAEVCEQAGKRHDGSRTQHLHTNVLVDLERDTATAEANLIVTFVPESGDPTQFYQVGTRYSFGLVRTGDGWRFASISDRLIWRSGPPDSARARPDPERRT
jgi:hypothetical protein